MIYLDGSRFFFDIEGCFSKLVDFARKQNAGVERDKCAAKLCKNFAEYCDADIKNIRAAKDHTTALRALLSDNSKVIIPEFDDSAKYFEKSFPGKAAILFKKPSSMKICAADLAAFANKSGVDAIFLSSPCCPTSLEMTLSEISALTESTNAKIIIDESHLVEEENSIIKFLPGFNNLIVLKKLRFGGKPVFAVGNDLPEFDCEISAEDQAAACVIFEHASALRMSRRKLEDSRNSLYIRIKKLAVKFDSLERLYRSKADCIFFKVKNASEKAKSLEDKGIAVRCENGYLCIFAGSSEENKAVLKALEMVL